MPIRKSSISGVPFGTTSDRPLSPSIGQTYNNGTLSRLEIYTADGWKPLHASPQSPTILVSNSGSNRPYNNGRASITITPASLGGPASIYTVTSSPAGYSASSSSTSFNLDGLLSNTAYTFSVVASNDYGISASSVASNSITITACSHTACTVISSSSCSATTAASTITTSSWSATIISLT